MFLPNKKPLIIKIRKPKILESNAKEETNKLKKYKSDKTSDTRNVNKTKLKSVKKSERKFFIETPH